MGGWGVGWGRGRQFMKNSFVGEGPVGSLRTKQEAPG